MRGRKGSDVHVFGGKKKDAEEKERSDELNAFLGAGTEFHGRLEFSGTVRIDGEFQGEIESQGVLVLGREALVKGMVRVGGLFCSGRIEGEVEAHGKAVFHSQAVMTGTVRARSLVIDEGATIEGEVLMRLMAVSPVAAGVLAAQAVEASPADHTQ